MKLAFSTLGSPKWDIEQTARLAQQYGYDGVELRIYQGKVIPADMPADERRYIKQTFADHGIAVCCVSASTRFSSADEGERSRQEDELRRYLDLARDLDSPLVRTFGGQMPEGVDEHVVFAYVAESLQRVAEQSAGSGVNVVLETHDAFSSGRTVNAVLSRVAATNVGALWDTHHPYRSGETAEQTYQLLRDRLMHTHVKDARRKDDGWQLVLLGEGEVPVAEVLQTLQGHGYDGWVCVEWEKMWHPDIEDPEVALPQHIKLLRRYLGMAGN